MPEKKSSVLDDIDEQVINSEPEKSELAKVVEILLNEKWKRRKTRLRQRLVSNLTTIDTLAQIYDIAFLKSWVDGYTEYVTSTDGKGREEIVDITKYTLDKEISKERMMLESLGRR